MNHQERHVGNELVPITTPREASSQVTRAILSFIADVPVS